MSVLKISLDIMKTTNNIVNYIDFFKDCPFKIPIFFFFMVVKKGESFIDHNGRVNKRT